MTYAYGGYHIVGATHLRSARNFLLTSSGLRCPGVCAGMESLLDASLYRQARRAGTAAWNDRIYGWCAAIAATAYAYCQRRADLLLM